MISDDVIDALVASGCSPEQLAAAVKASRKKSSGAARQAAYRARQKVKEEVEQVAGDIEVTPVTSRDVTERNEASPVTDGSSLSPVPLLPPTPPNNPLTPKPISKNQNSRAHRLPETASIAGPDLAYGLSRGMTQRETAELWQRMASWAWSAGGANAKKVNWHQAFQGWVQREGPEIIRKRTPGKPLTEHQRKQHELKDILNDLDNFATGGGRGHQENLGGLRYDPSERPAAIRSGAYGDLVDISPSGRHEGG